jgi:hypothetical protein
MEFHCVQAAFVRLLVLKREDRSETQVLLPLKAATKHAQQPLTKEKWTPGRSCILIIG